MDTTATEMRAFVAARRALPAPEMRRAIRNAAGVSLRQVAAVIGVSASAVALWEAGAREPRPSNLEAYVALLEELRSDG